jgi:hypothetical protein
MHILRLIVWYRDFLLNLNSYNLLKILMFRETFISFDVFHADSERFALQFVNEIE